MSIKARARAFGIDIASEFPLGPAFDTPGGKLSRGKPVTLLRLGSAEEVDADWPRAEATRVEEFITGDGEIGLAIDEHPTAGYRLDAGVFGRYRVPSDGMSVTCAVDGVLPWRRERFLAARVLPLAATLRGMEVFHAGCVGLGDHAIGLFGASHAGKTSLSVQMALQGASFFGDDLLTVEDGGQAARVHPGAGLAGLRHPEFKLLAPADRRRLGTFVDRGDKVWLTLKRATSPLPLGAAYLLYRGRDVESLAFDPLVPPDPWELVGSSFFQFGLTGPRVARQLGVCARIAETAPIFWVMVPPAVNAAELAARIRTHAEAQLGHAHAA